MKRLLAALILIAGAALAADNVPTNYFAGYVYVGGASNAGDTGLATATPYACFPVSVLVDLATNQAEGATGDIRALMYGIAQRFYLSYTNAPSTNRTQSTIGMTTSYRVSGTNAYWQAQHVLTTEKLFGAATLP